MLTPSRSRSSSFFFISFSVCVPPHLYAFFLSRSVSILFRDFCKRRLDCAHIFLFSFLRSLGGGTAAPKRRASWVPFAPFFFFFFFIFLIFPFGLFFVSQRVGPSNAGTTSLRAFQSSPSDNVFLFVFSSF